MLRSLRKKRGLTQAQLGQMLGVSQARVAEIEANPGVVGIAAMLKVLSTLGASLQLQVHDAFGAVSMAPLRAQGSGTTQPQAPAPIAKPAVKRPKVQRVTPAVREPTQDSISLGNALTRKPKRGTW